MLKTHISKRSDKFYGPSNYHLSKRPVIKLTLNTLQPVKSLKRRMSKLRKVVIWDLWEIRLMLSSNP